MKDSNTTAVSKSRVVAIDRSQLFYCQNSINPSSGHVVMKLPKDHMLKKGKSSDLNDDFIIHCMSKIFPREFTSPNKILLGSNITRAASQHFEVFELIKEIVRRAFPIKFWGSKDNFDVICTGRDTWQIITEPRIQSLVTADYFEEMHGAEISLELGAGKIRFLPKENGLRMITNTRNATRLTQGHVQGTFEEQSVDTNDKLDSLLDVLHFEKACIF
ncbi:hypothetical protein BD408DRAFT_400784 [Parasitella parasitica]|nr:hypothetical protein BD408DRAFT_400784 [Parasitella parasitica]